MEVKRTNNLGKLNFKPYISNIFLQFTSELSLTIKYLIPIINILYYIIVSLPHGWNSCILFTGGQI